MSSLEFILDGERAVAPAGVTLIRALSANGVQTPTLCYLEHTTAPNVCRVCVVEVEGSRPLVPACSRLLEEGMVVSSDSPRVRHARKLVFEMLASSVDLSLVSEDTGAWMREYDVDPGRFGPTLDTGGTAVATRPGQHDRPDGLSFASVARPPLIQDDLYVRDYAKCILCYQCVNACGPEAQNTFAISVAGRGFEARISTEFEIELPDSACVYCGNCIAVCPTGALIPKTEFDLRAAGGWAADRQSVTRTVCPYCGVGCNLELTVQDGVIVRVDSPPDHDVTSGNLCIKGRFGFTHAGVQPKPEQP
ncbi:MAG TPA: 2Fe-2S iron-sulfur cluster-binding protein [Acidimicrobiia bacterium]|nr:2Fe-2S iron-sulfur cluster-binding protein [Acidimicrobiia bacterium]